eukprot:CAMPEP_0182926832 /NCGR_PEP_ID=MMETSP0105_2-20130417/12352_1 /TAXON_ID=81532 ORGANISM="Acanthoeca-like sp., Strain 10tr" /NCGR_SAMPLE_ID=MMETSP0105_2 /ASSEMBLY_ACC=CAM_ASM_000205 /LENGTH=51 /DNA_ID=CAMNT_0025064743 /DNA_START=16 /DNA_END=171 /DNA_ORIENTATION=-
MMRPQQGGLDEAQLQAAVQAEIMTTASVAVSYTVMCVMMHLAPYVADAVFN